MLSQNDKGKKFAALHEAPGCFVIPNPWDSGSSKILAGLGFQALATTSAGFAFTLGQRDGSVSREHALKNAGDIATATDLPVTADLENGYGDQPETVSETIQLAISTGLVGASIEDATGRSEAPIYEFAQAVDRVAAAAQSAKSQSIPFIVTARAENYLYGRPDLKDTIERLQAYREVGADVLYAPGLKSLQDIETLVKEVDGPVNVVMGLSGARLTVPQLAQAGVKRISLGSSLNRAAFGALIRAAQEILEHGTFEFSGEAPSIQQMHSAFDSKG